ncbi:SprT family protein [Thalassobacillus sp. CUG 92003]|uniref:SprT family protein n=1 Tax=Thalassobacillus sp. CUG 92003 TaxID=2736641 RepID=UPI002103FA47|nr:SprT family protein [Thalassobacillus sp. CUG 92003]
MLQMTDQELQALTRELSDIYFKKPYPDDIVFNPRLRTTGGRYIPNKCLIEINPKYLQELGREELIGIIKHELCHYHLHVEGQPYHHRSQAFKTLMKQTGSPRHCKFLPSQANRRRHHYMCTYCQQEFRRVRQVDTKRYRCGRCKGKIEKKTIPIDET